jgi:hypothetical protein
MQVREAMCQHAFVGDAGRSVDRSSARRIVDGASANARSRILVGSKDPAGKHRDISRLREIQAGKQERTKQRSKNSLQNDLTAEIELLDTLYKGNLPAAKLDLLLPIPILELLIVPIFSDSGIIGGSNRSTHFISFVER